MAAASSPPSGTPALSASEVRVALSGAPILNGVSLNVSHGEVVAVMGGNGSGKTTLIRTLIGAVPRTGGEVLIDGKQPTRRRLSAVGYVPQRVTAASGVAATAREVVVSGLLGSGRLVPPRDARARAEAALEELGVADLASRDVARLSGGQQQRVLIARALVRRPSVLILDEPMAGVDLPSQEALAQTLHRLKDGGAAILIVLHELGVLAPLVDRAVVLEHGCVTHQGAPPAALGVHALPGHDHLHPHDNQPSPHPSPISWDGGV